ncbi:hypothetical protein U1Q18_005176 [Sarracenia purpurea var. burkii]
MVGIVPLKPMVWWVAAKARLLPLVSKGLAVGLKQVSKGLGKVFLCAPMGKVAATLGRGFMLQFFSSVEP